MPLCCLCCWSKNGDNSEWVFQGEETSCRRSNIVRGTACTPFLDLRKDLCAWKLLKYLCASISLMRDFTPTYTLCLAEAITALTARTAGVILGVSCNSCFSFSIVLGLAPLVSPGLPQTSVTPAVGCAAGRPELTPSSAQTRWKAQTKCYRWLCCFHWLMVQLGDSEWHSWAVTTSFKEILVQQCSHCIFTEVERNLSPLLLLCFLFSFR